jgi:DNA-binding CsgD family transcriptional regulator
MSRGAPRRSVRPPQPWWGTTTLSNREKEILEMLIDSAPANREIATAFGISEETVKAHLTNIMNKTGYSTRLELAIRMLQKRYESTKSPFVLALEERVAELERELAAAEAQAKLAQRAVHHLGAQKTR